jgi:hypothetical protein
MLGREPQLSTDVLRRHGASHVDRIPPLQEDPAVLRSLFFRG